MAQQDESRTATPSPTSPDRSHPVATADRDARSESFQSPTARTERADVAMSTTEESSSNVSDNDDVTQSREASSGDNGDATARDLANQPWRPEEGARSQHRASSAANQTATGAVRGRGRGRGRPRGQATARGRGRGRPKRESSATVAPAAAPDDGALPLSASSPAGRARGRGRGSRGGGRPRGRGARGGSAALSTRKRKHRDDHDTEGEGGDNLDLNTGDTSMDDDNGGSIDGSLSDDSGLGLGECLASNRRGLTKRHDSGAAPGLAARGQSSPAMVGSDDETQKQSKRQKRRRIIDSESGRSETSEEVSLSIDPAVNRPVEQSDRESSLDDDRMAGRLVEAGLAVPGANGSLEPSSAALAIGREIDGYSSSGASEVPLLLQAMRAQGRSKGRGGRRSAVPSDIEEMSTDNAGSTRQQTPLADFEQEPEEEQKSPAILATSSRTSVAPGDNGSPAATMTLQPMKKRRGRPPKARTADGSATGSTTPRVKKDEPLSEHKQKLLATINYERELIEDEKHPLFLAAMLDLDRLKDASVAQHDKVLFERTEAIRREKEATERHLWIQWEDDKRILWWKMMTTMIRQQRRLHLECADSDYTSLLCPLISCTMPPSVQPVAIRVDSRPAEDKKKGSKATPADSPYRAVVPYDDHAARHRGWNLEAAEIQQDLALIGLRAKASKAPALPATNASPSRRTALEGRQNPETNKQDQVDAVGLLRKPLVPVTTRDRPVAQVASVPLHSPPPSVLQKPSRGNGTKGEPILLDGEPFDSLDGEATRAALAKERQRNAPHGRTVKDVQAANREAYERDHARSHASYGDADGYARPAARQYPSKNIDHDRYRDYPVDLDYSYGPPVPRYTDPYAYPAYPHDPEYARHSKWAGRPDHLAQPGPPGYWRNYPEYRDHYPYDSYYSLPPPMPSQSQGPHASSYPPPAPHYGWGPVPPGDPPLQASGQPRRASLGGHRQAAYPSGYDHSPPPAASYAVYSPPFPAQPHYADHAGYPKDYGSDEARRQAAYRGSPPDMSLGPSSNSKMRYHGFGPDPSEREAERASRKVA